MIQFTLNGQSRTFEGDPEFPLLQFLREIEGLTSMKDGCAPQAACGACTVDLNGKAVLSCVIAMGKVEGGVVTTIEGLGEYRQQVFANAFAGHGGVQCGFCIPGIVMQANALINKNPDPSRAEIKQALTPNLCRCTGYKKIIDSIEAAAQAIRSEETLPPPSGNGSIGSRQPKYQAQKLVLGQHEYVDDIRMPGMLHGALKFSAYPRARVLSIDTSRAASLPGVQRVFSAPDIPGDRIVGLIRQDWPLMIAVDEETRYVGDVLALVVADSETLAREAVDLIGVTYEELTPVTDPHLAMQPEAPHIHRGGNILSSTIIKRGDLAQAQANSAYISRGVYQTQRIEHGYLEPEAAIAFPGAAGGITVLSQSQGVYEDQFQLASLLGLSEEQVRVVLVPNGGGFGGKEDLSVQGHAALAAYLLDAPVKVHLNRDESIRMHPKRHPIWMDYMVGCDHSGKLTFVKVKFIGDTGAYASVGMKVLERAAGHATGAYQVPAADIEAYAIYTNNVPCGAIRGFGVNQAIFGLEGCLDDLCEQGGFDRWQFRFNNAVQDGDVTATGQKLTGGTGIRATLLAVKDAFYAAKYTGLACGIKNTGIGNGMPDKSSARITILAPDRILIDHGWTEMGQGVNTIAIQVVCNETGLSPSLFEVRIDTAAAQVAGMTTASRATSLIGNALIGASRKLKQDLASHSLDELVGRQYQAEWRVDWTTKPGKKDFEPVTHYSYSYATQLVILDKSGQVEKVIAAHDAGKVFNLTLFEGQIEGSIHMGLGYAFSEDMPMEAGYPVSTRLRKMGILPRKRDARSGSHPNRGA